MPRSSCWPARCARSRVRCGASRAMRCRRSSAPSTGSSSIGERLQRCGTDLLQHGERQVEQLGKLLESYSFHSVLNRGFALVRDQDGHPVLAAAGTRAGDTIGIEFADGRVGARVTEGTGGRAARRCLRRRAAATAAAAIKDRCCKGKHHDHRAAVGRDHQELPVCQHRHRLDADAEARLSQQRHQRRAPAQSQGDAPRRAGLHPALHPGPRGSRQAADAQRSAERAARGDRGDAGRPRAGDRHRGQHARRHPGRHPGAAPEGARRGGRAVATAPCATRR